MSGLITTSWCAPWGNTQICVVRGTVSWTGVGYGAGDLQVWYHESTREYYFYATKTSGDYGAVCELLGSFSIDDGNGSENATFKMNSRFLKLCRVYSNLLKMASVGEFPWS